jgi:hypothetical protein
VACHARQRASAPAGGGQEDFISRHGASIMGKYLLGWLLGVPVVVLVVIYLIFN